MGAPSVEMVSSRALAMYARRDKAKIMMAAFDMVNDKPVVAAVERVESGGLPDAYADQGEVLVDRPATSLPPHRPYDLIDLVDGKMPPVGPLYGMSQLELETLSTWLTEQQAAGLVRPSKSPHVAATNGRRNDAKDAAQGSSGLACERSRENSRLHSGKRIEGQSEASSFAV